MLALRCVCDSSPWYYPEPIFLLSNTDVTCEQGLNLMMHVKESEENVTFSVQTVLLN